MGALEAVNIAGLTMGLVLKYAPQVLRLVHQVCHDLKDHPDPEIRKKVEHVHKALHGEPTRAGDP